MRLTTEAPDAATGRVRFVPTLNAGSGEVMGFHRHLLADRVRTGALLENRLRAAIQADIAGLRAELGTVRWAVGLIAAFLFVIGLRVFGLI